MKEDVPQLVLEDVVVHALKDVVPDVLVALIRVTDVHHNAQVVVNNVKVVLDVVAHAEILVIKHVEGNV